MIIVYVIIFIIACIFIGLNTGTCNKTKKIGEIGTIVSVFVLYALGLLGMNESIPAIEVYRGNIELQITYQDSIPIDSVVVYKNK